jgi:hypothetical protein
MYMYLYGLFRVFKDIEIKFSDFKIWAQSDTGAKRIFRERCACNQQNYTLFDLQNVLIMFKNVWQLILSVLLF